MLQNLTVGLIVIAAALFVTWRLAGAGTRLHWLESLGTRFTGSGKLSRLLQGQIARRRAAMLAATGCSACSAATQKEHQPLLGRTKKN